MKKALILLAVLIPSGIAGRSQSGPFSPGAAVTLDIQPPNPAAGSDFTVAIHVNLQGVYNGSAAPAALGGFVIPVAFDNTRVTLKSATRGPAAGFLADMTHTDISRANARGCVTVVNSQIGTGTPTGDVHVATLTFTAEHAGRAEFNVKSARASHEGSLASTFDPAHGGGPAPIGYADRVSTLQVEQAGAPIHLTFPSFVSAPSQFQGVAIFNEDSASAALTIRAFDVDGNLLARTGMANPRTIPDLAANTQYVRVVEEIFALADRFGTDRGWIDVESTSPNISGFFLLGHAVNGITTEMDGVDVSHTRMTHAIFPVVGKDISRETEVIVVNPGPTVATGSLRLWNSDGSTRRTFAVSIPPRGLFERAFPSGAVEGDGYLELQMTNGEVTGLEKFGSDRALACLAAQDARKAANILYAPHLASGNAGSRYFTEVNVINPNSQAANATFRLFNDQGVESVGAVTRTIEARSQLRIRCDLLFGLPDPAAAAGYTTGFIRVECDRGLVGNITFGDAAGNFLSSLPLLSTSSAKREICLDHVALGTIAPITYWTGIAIVNASREREAHIAIRLYDAGSRLVGQTTKTISRNGRLLNLVHELGPDFNVSQFGGFIQITSDVEVFTFMLFGDTATTFLSAVPVR